MQQYMSGFCLHISGPQTGHIPLPVLQSLQARLVCEYADYFWDSVQQGVLGQKVCERGRERVYKWEGGSVGLGRVGVDEDEGMKGCV